MDSNFTLDSTQQTTLWSTNWACTPSVVTLNGSFTMYNDADHFHHHVDRIGQTIINGCAEALSTSNSLLQSDTLSAASSPIQSFWQTVTPLVFALAVSITVAYMLLLISLMAHSKRPWLQCVAALSVVVSLTLAADLMVDSLQSVQNTMSLYNADQVRDVRANTALKVLRIISNALLWLAEVQVLIRLFPRHRDKVVIKWTGLGLIVLQTVCGILNDFIHPSPVNPNSPNKMVPAIPVLAYLFHIAIGVVYAVCVLFYTVSSGRWRHAYAPRNLLVATASLVSITFPLIFFCLDIWNDRVSGWGDYVRWASSIAASVVVWDWVDCTEARITKDSKTGVLGREVFEDEMFDGTKKAKSKRMKASPGKSFLHGRWRMPMAVAAEEDTTSKQDAELPYIRHPIVKASHLRYESSADFGDLSSTTRIDNNPADAALWRDTTNTTGNGCTSLLSTDASRDLGREHAKQNLSFQTRESYVSALVDPIRSDREQARQSFEMTDRAVHAGFHADDYWQDEKGA